jgi:hypothetical protein
MLTAIDSWGKIISTKIVIFKPIFVFIVMYASPKNPVPLDESNSMK